MTRLLSAVACAFMLVAAPAAASAQTIGFKIGPTFSKLDVDPDDDSSEQDRLTSFGGGGFVRFGVSGLALQLEALALTKGSKVSASDPDFGRLDAKLKMTYVEVPLTAIFNVGSGPYVFGGPTVGFELKCESELKINGSQISSECDEAGEPSGDDVFDRKKVDFGVTAGAGIQFPLGPGSLLVEGRHTWGLTNLAGDSTVGEQKLRHRTIAVFAGYAIPIGNR